MDLLDDKDEWGTKFNIGEMVRYVGCSPKCGCATLSEEWKREIAPWEAGKMHIGRSGKVQMAGNWLCKMEICVGASLIGYIDHFEAVDVR